MGVHHAWGRTLKDLYQRYKSMNGFQQRYQNGFDCQGLWVEIEVEKDSEASPEMKKKPAPKGKAKAKKKADDKDEKEEWLNEDYESDINDSTKLTSNYERRL